MSDRIDNIEMTLAHQLQDVQDLSDMVNELRNEVDRLKHLLRGTCERLHALEQGGVDTQDKQPLSTAEIAEREKPPHY